MTTLADVIEAQKDVIVERWLERIRPLAPDPNLGREALLDTLPEFLNGIVLALRRLRDPSVRAGLPHRSPIAQVHGEQRDRLHFSVNSVAREYPLLHEEILVVAAERQVSVSAAESVVLAQCMGTGSAEALSHFSQANESELLRETATAQSERRKAVQDLETVQAAERRASESEHRLRVLIDTLPFLIAFVDKDERYTLNNRAYLSWFGAESTVGRRVRDVVGPETYATIQGYIQRALAGEPVQYEEPYRFGSGRRGWVRGTYVPFRDGNGDTQASWCWSRTSPSAVCSSSRSRATKSGCGRRWRSPARGPSTSI